MEELEELEYALDERRVSFVLDEEIYPRDAVYGAAYLFVDKCWLFLTRPADRQIGVRLKPKAADGVTAESLEALAGEFGNELLNQVVRTRVGAATRDLREYYMARAFFGDDTRLSIDALLAELDAEELEEDELEVAVPWEKSEEGGGEQRISFSRSLYLPEAVHAAVAAYSQLATIVVDELGDEVQLAISEIDERVADRLVDALSNHVLYETVSRHRANEEV